MDIFYKRYICISASCNISRKLTEDHILNWSEPRDVVLGPFARRGTVGKMVAMNGRRYILIEKEAAYMEIIKKRIEM